jgi:hypothetical protein
MARISAQQNRQISCRMVITLNHLLHEEEFLRSKIITNFRPVTCRVYPVSEIDRGEANVIGKIIIREMREVVRDPIKYQEYFDTIFIWSDLSTTVVPNQYEDAIKEWLNYIKVRYG